MSQSQPLQISPPLPEQPPNGAAVQIDQVSWQQSSPVSRRALLTGLSIVASGLLIAGVGIAVARSRAGSGAGTGAASDPNPSDPIYIYRGYESQQQNNLSAPSSLGWSPDSTRVISSVLDTNARTNLIRIWNATDGGNALNYTGTEDASIGWVGNLPYAAWSDQQKVAHVQELTSGQHVASHVNAATTSWSPDSSAIVSIGSHKTISVWNPMNGQDIATLMPTPAPSTFYPYNMLWAPDNTQLLGWDLQGVLYVWDTHSGNLISSYHQLSDEYFAANPTSQFTDIRPIAWSPNNQWC